MMEATADRSTLWERKRRSDARGSQSNNCTVAVMGHWLGKGTLRDAAKA